MSRTRKPSETAIRRAVGYSFLARCLAYPDAQGAAALEEAAQASAPVLHGTPLAGLTAMAIATFPSELEQTYIDLFTLSSSPDCPTHETAYLDLEPTRQAMRLSDINGFYHAYGVDAVPGGTRPDDIKVELDFMGWLCRKEIYAREQLGVSGVARARRGQRLFLTEHLGRWGPEFASRLAEHAPAYGLYGVLAVALSAWLEEDFRHLKVFPDDIDPRVVAGWEAPGGYSHGPEIPGTASLIDPQSIALQ